MCHITETTHGLQLCELVHIIFSQCIYSVPFQDASKFLLLHEEIGLSSLPCNTVNQRVMYLLH